jgi:bifunctional non-homologous end joining protein LigD
MNGHGQQIVAPYSVRPETTPSVAAPVRWDELDSGLDPRDLTTAAVVDRVARMGDLHEEVLRGRQHLRPALERAATRSS